MMKPRTRRNGNGTLAALVVLALLLAGCTAGQDDHGASGLPEEAADLARDRGMSQDDIYAALKTYMPTGEHDPYIMLASGGHSGQVLVVGVPSMRILKVIGVFTPEPWQGYGYGAENEKLFHETKVGDTELRWGDTHHPALSETNGVYDGQSLFINDKANARLAIIDLKDFETKQIVKNPNAISDHGGTFVTPNTEYIVEGPQYATPIGWEHGTLDRYQEDFRGVVTFWAYDRAAGRVDEASSFQIELPPYWQDLCDAGKGPSYGWAFCNSINTEMATGLDPDDPDSAPFEAGASRNDMDYLHIMDWEKAAQVVEDGKAESINGIDVIRLDTAIEEGLLFLAPEPKSPHGADVTPGGEYIAVSGKLDPHVAVYSFEKIQNAIAAGTTETDAFGIPVLAFEDVLEAQVEVGLGPLHTVYDDKGYAYTSLFLDSAVARWTLGGPYDGLNADAPWELVQTLPVHYNIGHITAAGGDTAEPNGEYVVALNKWSLDRFANVGPLMPQNFQLVDIEKPHDTMRVLYDMPIGMAEPHYAQIIRADKLDPWQVYPRVGWNPETQSPHPEGIQSPDEVRVERDGNDVEIWMAAVRSHYTPERIEIQEGDNVTWHITNIEKTPDATHGFQLSGYNIQLSLEPGETQTIEFVADNPGTYTYYCTEFCSALHLEMTGYMFVEPA